MGAPPGQRLALVCVAAHYPSQRYREAQNNLGIMYLKGQGVPNDNAEAVRWFRKAAEQGHAGAQFNFGVMYIGGLGGMPQDYVQAHMWLSLAASDFEAGKLRDDAVEFRDDVAAVMNPAQIAEAQKLAREWRPASER